VVLGIRSADGCDLKPVHALAARATLGPVSRLSSIPTARVPWRIAAALSLGLGLALAAPGCASRYKLDADSPAYAAQAKIAVKLNKTGNRQIKLEIRHLAPPQKIDPAGRAYVAWIAVPGSEPVKAGVLEYNDRWRRGVLHATTPNPKFELVVTLEQSLRPSKPSSTEILRKLVSKI